MKRKRSRNKEQLQSATGRAVPLDRSANLPPARKWLFRLLAVSVVPLMVLGGVELCLRLAGFGYDPNFFKREMIGNQDCYVANETFGYSFFPRGMARFPPPVIMPVAKATDSFRIFIFGESAAMGDPRPNYGAGGYLEVMLTERFPQAKFEIINTSVTAINSHAILPIARECSGHAGDLWIIYMGNNEMVGPFGAATVFGAKAPPRWLVQAQLQARRLRLSQLLLSVLQRTQTQVPDAERWQGMEMFVQNQVLPTEPSRQRVYQNFERNLDDILAAGLSCGARIVLSTVSVNERDCAPFGSERPATNGATYEKLCEEGAAALAQGRFGEAQSAFQKATEMSPHAAEARFQLATSLLGLTNAPQARRNFLQAVDDDTLPFRADSRINGIIRAAADRTTTEDLVLCDAAESLSAASPHGIPGGDLFYEHVHLNQNGNYALALAWAETVEKLLPLPLKRDARSNWIAQAECEQWLGLTDWNRISILEQVLQRIQRPPFTGQSGHTQQVLRLENEISQLRQQLTDAAASRAQEVYLRALRRAPNDFRLHANYAEFLEARREWNAAIAARKRALELTPGSYFPHYALGVDLKEAGALAEAREVLLRAAALKPDDADVRVELGMVAARQGDWEEARRELELADRSSSDDSRIPLYLGEALWKLNRRGEALTAMRKAVRLSPDDWQPRYRLANCLAQDGDFATAATEYAEALRLNPTNVRAKVGFATTLLNLRREPEALQQLDEALQLEPANESALQLQQKLQRR